MSPQLVLEDSGLGDRPEQVLTRAEQEVTSLFVPPGTVVWFVTAQNSKVADQKPEQSEVCTVGCLLASSGQYYGNINAGTTGGRSRHGTAEQSRRPGLTNSRIP